MRLVQFITAEGERCVGMVSEDAHHLHILDAATHVRDLALEADRTGIGLEQMIAKRVSHDTVDYEAIIAENRLLPPLDHPDPAHCILSGTGLDHLGSAQARDAMHAKLEGEAEQLTDSMKMFKIGLEGGKPEPGLVGSEPEWFYKGDGSWLVAPGQPLELPAFAQDGSEEPELVGLYVISDRGRPLRVGFALGNEYSDHILEKQNYLYLAHSKLRQSSFGPEILIGEPPADIRGTVRILRNGDVAWSGEFLTGEANMTHSLANIQHHHFKYAGFRRPGDVHCHYYGTATLSFAAGFSTQPGDVFEIMAPDFGRPLRNQLIASEQQHELVEVDTL